MKNLKSLCLALLLLVGTIAQEAETQSEAEEGLTCNTEDGEGCEASDYLGLRDYNGRGLKLIDISSSVYIEAPYAQITHTLVYENDYDEPVDLVFYYNKPDNSIISSINATWEGRDVEAEVISQEDAEDAFSRIAGNSDAFDIAARGIPAFLVGRVPPGRDVTVQYTIIQPLALIENEYWGFSLYNSIAADDDFENREWNSTVNYDGTILQSADLDNWDVDVVVSSRRPVDNIVNPTHNIESVRSEVRNRSLETWDLSIDFDKDFVLFWTSPRIHNPNYIFTKHPTLESDWIFGYTLVPQSNNRLSAGVLADILSSPTLAEVNEDDSEDLVLVNVNSTASCNNTNGDTIFNASSTGGSVGRDKAYEQYFFLRDLVNPDGCRIRLTYLNNFTKATTTSTYVFRGFVLARDTDEWHKIAYTEQIDKWEDGEETSSTNLTSDEITNLAVRYQVDADNTLWVTTTEVDDQATILDDSLRYYFSPEDGAGLEDNEDGEAGNDNGNAEDGNEEEAPEENVEDNNQSSSTTTATVVIESHNASGNIGDENSGDNGGY